MGTSFLTQWFSGGEIKAICWTLIHSLWIGMIIALLSGIVIATTRKSAAALRYRLLCGILALFVISVSVIFCIEMRTTGSVQTNPANVKIFMSPANIDIADHEFTAQHISPVKVIVNFLDSYINIIFIVWLLFFIMKSLKMMGGLLYIQRIRNYKVHEVSEEFKHKIELFSRQIGIRQTVRLVQSELVKVPVAVGWLKPVILLPMGIIFQLTPEQLDGILWHELAHIRRRDYLVNILQGLVETVFFFNPGLLWLSSLIRAEREACCDDLVLSQMSKKANYLEALLSFGYGEYKQASLAMGIGSGNQLHDRLRRMISQENKRLSIAEKAVLSVGLILVSAFTAIPKNSAVARHLTLHFNSHTTVSVRKPDTIEHVIIQKSVMEQDKPGTKKQVFNDIVVVKRDTSVTFVSVLFKNSDSDPANTDIRAMDNKGNRYHFVTEDNKIIAMEINRVKVDDDKLLAYDYMLANIERELAEKRRIREEDKAMFKAMSPAARVEVMKQQHISDSIKAMRYAAPKFSRDLQSKMINMRERMHDDSLNYDAELKKMQDVIADLVHDKVVPNADAVKWFGLSDTEFIVNGQKQAGEMQQRYKAKYGVHEGWGLYYGPVQMTGRGVFIDLTVTEPGRLPHPPHSMRPERPGPKSVGAIGPFNGDSIAWKNRQLILQQQRFAAGEEVSRQEIERQQKIQSKEQADRLRDLQEQQHNMAILQDENRRQLEKEQQILVAGQAKSLKELTQQQQAFVTEQNEKRAQILQQQQALLAQQYEKARQLRLEYDVDLKPAISGVIADLVSANVISDKSQLSSFSLTNNALMVNGKKQADDIHEKLKSKYLERSAYPGIFRDWNLIKDNPNFGLHFDTSGGEGLGIMAKRYSQ